MGGQEAGALRRANTATVVAELRLGGATSRAHLARRTGLAKQTVSTIVSTLLADGVVRELGLAPTEPGGGRPAVLVAYAADRAHVLGVELGVGRARVVLADILGVAVGERSLPGPRPGGAGPTPEAVLAEVVALGLELVAERGGSALSALGVSVTGLVRPATGTCVLAPNLGWHDVPVADLLRRELERGGHQVPVVVRGAAQAALLAELREGAARGLDDVVLLFEDEGVGAAIAEAGGLRGGVDGTAGELGHCPWPGASDPCGCGRTGCVETLTSGPAVRRTVEGAVGHPLELGRAPGEPTYAALARLAREHSDDLSRAIEAASEQAGRVLGTAAAWLVALTAPRAVVLSGALALAPEPLRAALRDTLVERALGEPPRLLVGDLGDGASARGAVLLAVDEARRVAAL